MQNVDLIEFRFLPRYAMQAQYMLSSSLSCVCVCVCVMHSNAVADLQGASIKNNHLGKNNYLSYCNRFFHQIHSFYRGGFRQHRQQISLRYLLWFKNCHYL